MSPPTLTIAIPTYNRRQSLLCCLERLLPQLDEECELLILDNDSAEPVEEYALDCLRQCSNLRYRIVRHAFNIGADANILRCFELATGKWLWVLGDDDLVVPDAVTIIRRTVGAHPDAAMTTFLTTAQAKSNLRADTFTTRGAEEFAIGLDLAHQLNFMSCSVWRAQEMAEFLCEGYRHTYTMGWAFALVIPATIAGHSILFSHDALVEEATTVTMSGRWSYRRFLLGWPILLEQKMSPTMRRRLAWKMLRLFSPEVVVAYCLADNGRESADATRYYYQLARLRLRPYQEWHARIRSDIYALFFLWPRLTWRFVKLTINLAKRLKLKNINAEELEQRNWI